MIVSVDAQPVHIHAPKPSRSWASSDHNCPARARDGRRCGGRRMLLRHTPWYGVSATCYHCGAHYGGDGIQTTGRADTARTRAEWNRLASEGAVS